MWYEFITTESYLNNVHFYNTEAQVKEPTWKLCTNKGPENRRYHSAVIHANYMYIFGGYADMIGSTCELWQFDCGTFTTISSDFNFPVQWNCCLLTLDCCLKVLLCVFYSPIDMAAGVRPQGEGRECTGTSRALGCCRWRLHVGVWWYKQTQNKRRLVVLEFRFVFHSVKCFFLLQCFVKADFSLSYARCYIDAILWCDRDEDVEASEDTVVSTVTSQSLVR